jgi:hypothetical protein
MVKLSEQWTRLVATRARAAIARSRRRSCTTLDTMEQLVPALTATLLRQQFCCAICSHRMTTHPHHQHVASVDRLSSLKCNYLRNARWTCAPCNAAKRACFMPRARYVPQDCSDYDTS